MQYLTNIAIFTFVTGDEMPQILHTITYVGVGGIWVKLPKSIGGE